MTRKATVGDIIDMPDGSRLLPISYSVHRTRQTYHLERKQERMKLPRVLPPASLLKTARIQEIEQPTRQIDPCI